jgi:hypothetical protein
MPRRDVACAMSGTSGHRVVLRGEDGMLERAFERSAVRIGHHTGVFEDHVIEAGAIECARHVDVEAPRPVWAVVVRPRIIPGVDGEIDEPSQVKALRLRHRMLLWAFARSSDGHVCSICPFSQRHGISVFLSEEGP